MSLFSQKRPSGDLRRAKLFGMSKNQRFFAQKLPSVASIQEVLIC